jgi:hypothetical protein
MAVRDGFTVMAVTVTQSGMPFLREQRRDLLILITPYIIDDLVAPTGQ